MVVSKNGGKINLVKKQIRFVSDNFHLLIQVRLVGKRLNKWLVDEWLGIVLLALFVATCQLLGLVELASFVDLDIVDKSFDLFEVELFAPYALAVAILAVLLLVDGASGAIIFITVWLLNRIGQNLHTFRRV